MLSTWCLGHRLTKADRENVPHAERGAVGLLSTRIYVHRKGYHCNQGTHRFCGLLGLQVQQVVQRQALGRLVECPAEQPRHFFLLSLRCWPCCRLLVLLLLRLLHGLVHMNLYQKAFRPCGLDMAGIVGH